MNNNIQLNVVLPDRWEPIKLLFSLTDKDPDPKILNMKTSVSDTDQKVTLFFKIIYQVK